MKIPTWLTVLLRILCAIWCILLSLAMGIICAAACHAGTNTLAVVAGISTLVLLVAADQFTDI